MAVANRARTPLISQKRMPTMPELPDVTVYVERTAAKTVGHPLRALELRSAFVLRTAVPPASDLVGRDVVGVRRLGKRVVLEFAAHPAIFLVIHLMIAGRLHWHAAERAVPRHALAVMRFDHGNLVMTEAGTRKRASLHVVQGADALDALDPKGLEPLSCSYGEFAARLKAGNHTLKRALTDPRTLSGIGNSYSDEILHRAQLSPLTLTQALDEPGLRRLYNAMRAVLDEWTRKLRSEAGDDFPQKVTAFRDGMAVHGRYGQPCPVCGAPVQRILYADNETNYCARCQTGGRVLADRALSRLLKASFPRDIDQLG
jgi:formamidopyrimidine-DNA glycosylase